MTWSKWIGGCTVQRGFKYLLTYLHILNTLNHILLFNYNNNYKAFEIMQVFKGLYILSRPLIVNLAVFSWLIILIMNNFANCSDQNSSRIHLSSAFFRFEEVLWHYVCWHSCWKKKMTLSGILRKIPIRIPVWKVDEFAFSKFR